MYNLTELVYGNQAHFIPYFKVNRHSQQRNLANCTPQKNKHL